MRTAWRAVGLCLLLFVATACVEDQAPLTGDGRPIDTLGDELSSRSDSDEGAPALAEPVTADQAGGEGPVAREEWDRFVAFRTHPGAVELVWRDETNAPYGQLEVARQALERDGRVVHLIANAGIYTPEQSPAGLHIEDGVELVAINLNEGGGNFHLLPNGVFAVEQGESGARAVVLESNRFAAEREAGAISPDLAVQSGPLLTIDGALHPQFSPDGTSRFIRNGVGVANNGDVVFLISTEPVTFSEFAEAFLTMDVPNALYLDGSISRTEAPVPGEPIFLNIPFAAMLAVVE